MKNKPIKIVLLTLVSTLCFAAPQQPQNGGTGISNPVTSTLSLPNGYPITLNTINTTNVTLPQSGTLLNADTSSPGDTFYVTDFAGMDISSCGSIALPCATVSYAEEAAYLAGVSQATVRVDGVINDPGLFGQLIIFPNVNVVGNPGSVINTNIVVLATSPWGAAPGNSVIRDIGISASSGIVFDFTASGSQQSNVLFDNVDFLNSDSIEMLGTGIENVQFNNIHTSVNAPVPMYLANINATVNSSVFGLLEPYNDSSYPLNTTVNIYNTVTGLLDLESSGSQTLTVNSVASPQTIGNDIVIDGTNAFWYPDVASYNSPPIFEGGATPDVNVILTSLSDAINVTYGATNYTPIPTGEYSTNALTAHLAGIDAALTPSAAFAAYLSTAQTNVTGDGTIYQLICDAQDTSSPNYNPTTGVFTADKNGFYQFSGSVNLFNLTSGMTSMKLWLFTTSNTYVIDGNNPFAGQDGFGDFTSIGSATVWLNAGDTVDLGIEVDGGPKQVGIYSSSNPIFAFFGGSYLGTSTGGGGGNVTILDDNSTNATMYPTWVSGTPGSQQVYTSSNILQFNPGGNGTPGVPSLSFENSGFVYMSVASTTSGGEAGYMLNRDDISSYAQTHYETTGVDHWVTGLRGGDSDFHFFNIDTDVDDIIISDSDNSVKIANGNLNVANLTPNEFVATDSSNNLISVAGPGATQAFTWSWDSGNSSGISGTPVFIFGTMTPSGNYVTANFTIGFVPTATTVDLAFHAPLVSPGVFPIGVVVSATGTVYKDLLTGIGDGQIGYAGNTPINFSGTDTIDIPMQVVATGVAYYVNVSMTYQYQNF